MLAVVATAWWARDRGLDLTDESYYLLSLRPAQTRLEVMFDWAQAVVAVTGHRELSVATWRTVAVVLVAATTGAFGTAGARFARARNLGGGGWPVSGALLAPAAALGGLFASAVLPLTLSYNTLTLAVAYGAAGLALWALAPADPATRGVGRPVAAAAAVGLLLAFQLIVKAPAAIALAALLGGFAALAGGPWSRARAVALGAAAAGGVAAAVLAYVARVRPAAEYASLLSEQLRALSGTTHGTGALLVGYARDARRVAVLAVELIPCYAAVAAAGRVGARGVGPRAVVRRRVWLLCGAATGWIILHALWRDHRAPLAHPADRLPLYVAWLLVVPALGVGAVWTRGRANADDADPDPGGLRASSGRPGLPPRPAVALLALASLLPLAAAVGTNNMLFAQAALSGAGWVTACAVVLQRAAAWPALRTPAAGLLAVLLAGVAGETVNGLVRHPYRLATPRPRQRVPLHGADPAVGPLRVDDGTRALVDSLARVLRAAGFRRGDAVLALYDMPGLPYLIGGTSPGAIWFASEAEEQPRNCAALRRGAPPPGRPVFALVDRPVGAAFLACLRASGVAELSGARPVATLPMRDPKGLAGQRLVRVYVLGPPSGTRADGDGANTQ